VISLCGSQELTDVCLEYGGPKRNDNDLSMNGTTAELVWMGEKPTLHQSLLS